MKKYLIILMIFCFYQNGNSQSIKELILVAIENNLGLKSLEKEYESALEKAPQVSQFPDPELGVGLFPLPIETRLGAQFLRVGATQMFPWKGLLNGKKDLELAKAKVLYEQVGANALDLAFQIKQAYFKLYELEKSQTIIQRNLNIFNSLEQLALTKIESGKGSATDVLRIQLKTEELQQELMILDLAKTKPITTINQLLNRPLQTPIIVNDSLSFAILPLDQKALITNIEENHPMLRMFELQQDISNQKIALNKIEGKPSFGAGLDYMMVSKRTDAEPVRNGRDIIQVRGSVKIPLFRKKYAASVREEKLKIASLSDRKTDLLTSFIAAVEKAYVDYETAKLRIDLYTKQIKITRAAIRILTTNYSASGAEFSELLNLEKELIDYDFKILNAVVKSHLAKSEIERYLVY